MKKFNKALLQYIALRPYVTGVNYDGHNGTNGDSYASINLRLGVDLEVIDSEDLDAESREKLELFVSSVREGEQVPHEIANERASLCLDITAELQRSVNYLVENYGQTGRISMLETMLNLAGIDLEDEDDPEAPEEQEIVSPPEETERPKRSSKAATADQPKRPRGRPRKHPLPDAPPSSAEAPAAPAALIVEPQPSAASITITQRLTDDFDPERVVAVFAKGLRDAAVGAASAENGTEAFAKAAAAAIVETEEMKTVTVPAPANPTLPKQLEIPPTSGVTNTVEELPQVEEEPQEPAAFVRFRKDISNTFEEAVNEGMIAPNDFVNLAAKLWRRHENELRVAVQGTPFEAQAASALALALSEVLGNEPKEAFELIKSEVSKLRVGTKAAEVVQPEPAPTKTMAQTVAEKLAAAYPTGPAKGDERNFFTEAVKLIAAAGVSTLPATEFAAIIRASLETTMQDADRRASLEKTAHGAFGRIIAKGQKVDITTG